MCVGGYPLKAYFWDCLGDVFVQFIDFNCRSSILACKLIKLPYVCRVIKTKHHDTVSTIKGVFQVKQRTLSDRQLRVNAGQAIRREG